MPLLAEIMAELIGPQFSDAVDCPGTIAGNFMEQFDVEIAQIGESSACFSPNPEKAETRMYKASCNYFVIAKGSFCWIAA
jgi:hypothetical protein